MKLHIPKPKLLFFLGIFIITLILSRTINLDHTARFIWDESSDIVNIHQIWTEKKLTLIGPISEDGSKVFGSLTYYMLIPFAIAGNFDPVSTAYGAVFWGILTGLLILYLTFKVNKKFIFLMAPMVVFWYPLVETGRWAWNPNLIPFWVTLALIFFFRKEAFSKLLAGIFIGLSIHLHYLAIFAATGLGLIIFRQALIKKEFKQFILYSAGVFITILPFMLFDLTHPPGLFLSRILYFNYLSPTDGSVSSNIPLIGNFITTFIKTLNYFSQNTVSEVILIILLILILVNDIRHKSPALNLIFVIFIQIVGVSFVTNFYTHYIIPILPFFLIYIIFPRKNTGQILSYLTVTVLLVSSLISFPRQITKTTWESNIASTRQIVSIISNEISQYDLLNNNVAVVASPDPNLYGRRYRDLLLIQNINLKTKGEYDITDHLFVVSTSDLETIRKDPAYEVQFFNRGNLVAKWNIAESNWKVYLLTRNSI